MDKKETGGPAYPSNEYAEGSHNGGMTLRDYFAGQALIGLINSTQDFVFKTLIDNNNHEEIKIELEKLVFDVPIDSYRIADAMLKERNK